MSNFQQNSLALLFFTSFVLNPEQALGYDDPSVELTSDGPVVLDATITFQAKLKNVQDYEPPFYFSWSKSFNFITNDLWLSIVIACKGLFSLTRFIGYLQCNAAFSRHSDTLEPRLGILGVF